MEDVARAVERLGGQERLSALRPKVPEAMPKDPALERFRGNYSKNKKTESETVEEGDKAAQLVCALDPDDRYAPTLVSETVKSSSLLVRVRRRRAASGDIELEGTIVGIMPAEVRFNGFADFQTTNQTEEDPLFVVPPRFSQYDTPKPFWFQEGMWKYQESRHKRLIGKGTRIPGPLDFHDADIPMPKEPRPGLNASLLQLLTAFFEQQPIWEKSYLMAMIEPATHDRAFTLHVIEVAYRFSNGPWRNAWIRKGYDPRESSESLVFQMLDFRIDPSDFVVLADEYPATGHVDNTVAESEMGQASFQRKAMSEETRQQLSFMRPPSAMAVLYQLSFIEDSDIRRTIDEAIPASTCSKASGWLTTHDLNSIRRQMKDRVRVWVANAQNLPLLPPTAPKSKRKEPKKKRPSAIQVSRSAFEQLGSLRTQDSDQSDWEPLEQAVQFESDDEFDIFE